MIYLRSQRTLFELWRPIGFLGAELCIWSVAAAFPYDISNWGSVGNHLTGKILRPSLNDYTPNCQYLRVQLWGSNGRRAFYVHRLVGKLWVPGETAERFQIDHDDGEKYNNCAYNLEWVTPQENNRRRDYRIRHCGTFHDNGAPF